MRIIEAKIAHFRNLNSIHLNFHHHFNIIHGKNGCGKTSILESLYYLTHGKSFRSHLIERIIQLDEDHMSIYGEFVDENHARTVVGIYRDRSKNHKIHLQHSPIQSTAALAKIVPVILINPDSFQFFDGGPSIRRGVLDWLLFHVEPDYHKVWLDFKHCLKQRNFALKMNLPESEIELWNKPIIQLSEEIDRYRSHYTSLLYSYFFKNIQQFLPNENITFHYYRGWNEEQDIKALLEKHISQDRERGYTYYGPHRADLILKINQLPLQAFLSRGQQKITICALRIAQLELLHQYNKSCVVLLDDLSSELDESYRNYLLAIFRELNAQIFITVIDSNMITDSLVKEYTMFHVEHGVVKI